MTRTRFVRQVQTRHVARHAHNAITRRVGYAMPGAVISVERDPDVPGTVILHVNSGGNALECESALRAAGYRVRDRRSPREDQALRADYGVKIRVLPGVGAQPAREGAA